MTKVYLYFTQNFLSSLQDHQYRAIETNLPPTNHAQLILMTPSFHSPSRYLHLCTPSRTLGPASGEVGELVARPPFMWASLAVIDFLMLQVVSPSFTNKTLGSPSTFLNTGRPLLHFPSSNLSKMYRLFGFHRHGISDNFLTYNHRGFSLAFPPPLLPQSL